MILRKAPSGPAGRWNPCLEAIGAFSPPSVEEYDAKRQCGSPVAPTSCEPHAGREVAHLWAVTLTCPQKF
jgi:hypothetical protein